MAVPRGRPPPLAARRRWLQRTAPGLLAAWAASATGAAVAFPVRPVRIVVPQAPGGAADQLVRLLAARLEALWGQSVVIEYKPGGGAVLATQMVARSAPDGYTLGSSGSSLTLNAVLRKDLPYRLAELMPVVRVGWYTTVLLAHPGLAAGNVRELLALARSTPLNYGSNGVGSAAHLAGELLNQAGGVAMQHVPYNGASKMYTDMIGGRLPLGLAIAGSAETFVRAGQLKVLGVTNPQRSALFPHWPAIAETLPGYEALNWAGLIAPVGLPAEVTGQLSADLLKVLRDPSARKALTEIGVEVAELGAAEFAAFVQRDVERIAPLAARIGPLQ